MPSRARGRLFAPFSFRSGTNSSTLRLHPLSPQAGTDDRAVLLHAHRPLPAHHPARRGGGTLLLGLGLTGCRSAVSEAEAPAGKAATEPKRGGTLTVAVNSDFTPSLLFAQSGQSLQQRLIYNTLTRYDDQLKPQPELATSWKYAKDGRSVTLKLRTGVTYHDGRPFTADDVIFAVKNLQNPVRASQLRATAAAVAGFEKRGDHELVLRLAHPVNNLFDLFEFMILTDRNSVEDAVTGKKLNGTGPFKLTRWSPGAGLGFTRNEKYWQPGRPYLDAVEFRVIPRPTPCSPPSAPASPSSPSTSPATTSPPSPPAPSSR
ncbi:ABC transporter substrate-binding protein [Streptomyces diastatochromogenes]|nr:ABC transporter substrate-binding protein [Streptomyces diastatochromogenes]